MPEREGLPRVTRKLLQVVDMFTILMVAMISQVDTDVKASQVAHFKYVQFIVMSIIPQFLKKI